MINTDQQKNQNRKISNIENLPWKTEDVMQESNQQMNRIPACDILGVHIAAIDMNWLMQFTREHAEELSGEYICVSNVHTTVTAYDDPSYLTVQGLLIWKMCLQNQSDMDGLIIFTDHPRQLLIRWLRRSEEGIPELRSEVF